MLAATALPEGKAIGPSVHQCDVICTLLIGKEVKDELPKNSVFVDFIEVDESISVRRVNFDAPIFNRLGNYCLQN